MRIGVWGIGFPEKGGVAASLYEDGAFVLSGRGGALSRFRTQFFEKTTNSHTIFQYNWSAYAFSYKSGER